MPQHEPNSPKYRLQIRDPSLDAESVLQNYYRIVFALIRGGPQRPHLPLELVVYICRFAGFTQPNPFKGLSVQRVATLEPPRGVCGNFLFTAPPPKLETLLKTPPVAHKHKITTIVHFEIVARSLCDSSCTYTDHWKDFFVRITRAKEDKSIPDNLNPNGPPYPYVEQVELPQTLATSDLKGEAKDEHDTRKIIDRDHELWKWIKPGNRLEVAVKCYPVWLPVNSCDVVIRAFEAWEPSPAMLGFVRAKDPLMRYIPGFKL